MDLPISRGRIDREILSEGKFFNATRLPAVHPITRHRTTFGDWLTVGTSSGWGFSLRTRRMVIILRLETNRPLIYAAPIMGDQNSIHPRQAATLRSLGLYNNLIECLEEPYLLGYETHSDNVALRFADPDFEPPIILEETETERELDERGVGQC